MAGTVTIAHKKWVLDIIRSNMYNNGGGPIWWVELLKVDGTVITELSTEQDKLDALCHDPWDGTWWADLLAGFSGYSRIALNQSEVNDPIIDNAGDAMQSDPGDYDGKCCNSIWVDTLKTYRFRRDNTSPGTDNTIWAWVIIHRLSDTTFQYVRFGDLLRDGNGNPITVAMNTEQDYIDIHPKFSLECCVPA